MGREPVQKRLWLAAAVAVAGCASGPIEEGSDSGQRFSAEIRRTAYGVPHITARDYAGIGYGVGYASAEDNICELADRMLTTNGERAHEFSLLVGVKVFAQRRTGDVPVRMNAFLTSITVGETQSQQLSISKRSVELLDGAGS
jgi:hypothetical protein